MQNLFRRPSGIYVLRLAVPMQLRCIFKKTEIIASTNTRNFDVAKLVASAQAAQWRQRFFDADRLLGSHGYTPMDHQEILSLAHGHPSLLSEGYLPLQIAAAASGIGLQDLLRQAADGMLGLYIRRDSVPGYLIPLAALELDDPEVGASGGYIIPHEKNMPDTAIRFTARGLLNISASDAPSFANALLGGAKDLELVALELPAKERMLFAPNAVLMVNMEGIEVATLQVESLRRNLAARIDPAVLDEARELRKAKSVATQAPPTGRKGDQLLSTALDAYVDTWVRNQVAKKGEIDRIKTGCELLIQVTGDRPISEVNSESLRDFRVNHLSRVPAHENKIRLQHGTKNMMESMEIAQAIGWPIMSATEREKRMRWITSWFRWLHEQNWISNNPGAALRGERVLTKMQRKAQKVERRPDEARDPFTTDDLAQIFGSHWFKRGRGELTKQGTYRTFAPFYYWLPLFGLYGGGGRINELCQLQLSDIRKTEGGTWYIDFKADAEDQDLKTVSSKRIVPLHPKLLELGFSEWHAALAAAGYRRLFPELKFDTEKGYGKAATKWFSSYMKDLGIPRDGKKTFHSLRHTYANAFPFETPERLKKQMMGHSRGVEVHNVTYGKDVEPEVALKFVERLNITLPSITPFEVDAGLKSLKDALKRKNRGHGDAAHEAGA